MRTTLSIAPWEQILFLSEELERLRKLPALRRADQLHRYYRQFAHWVGDNLIHMEQEETEHNATLWAWYTLNTLFTLNTLRAW